MIYKLLDIENEEIKLIKDNKYDFKLSHEDEMLLCCARTRLNSKIKEKICSLTEKNLDWDHLFKMASIHGLRSLVYYNLNFICPENVPDNILNKLKKKYYENVHNNLLLTGELITILDKFESHGINAIHYKGPSLAILAYDNLVFREFIDIDIFVNKYDMYKAANLLISRGYKLESCPKGIDNSLYFKTQSEHKFIDNKSNIIVEIHNKFQGHFFSFPTSPEFLYTNDNLQRMKINNYSVNALSNENLLLVLSIHSARHDWLRLSWICDISELIQSQEIKWPEIIENAKKLCVLRILLVSLSLASDLFDLKLPYEIIDYLNSDPEVRKICFKIKKKIFSENKITLNIFERTMLDLKKRENAMYGLKDLVMGLTKPTYVDFEDISLPKYLYPLYYFIRPFLLLKRYGKDPI